MTKTLGDLKGLLPTKLERGNGHETRCKCTVCFHSYGYAQAHDEISAIPLMTIINKSFELGLIGKYGFAEGFSRRPEPLVRGMEIDVEAFAKEMFEVCVYPGLEKWVEQTNHIKTRWRTNAEIIRDNAHVWLKEKDSK